MKDDLDGDWRNGGLWKPVTGCKGDGWLCGVVAGHCGSCLVAEGGAEGRPPALDSVTTCKSTPPLPHTHHPPPHCLRCAVAYRQEACVPIEADGSQSSRSHDRPYVCLHSATRSRSGWRWGCVSATGAHAQDVGEPREVLEWPCTVGGGGGNPPPPWTPSLPPDQSD